MSTERTPGVAPLRRRGWVAVARLLGWILAIGAILALGIKAGTLAIPSPAPLPSQSAPTARSDDLHVSPDGDDTASGAADGPLATIQAALDRAAPGTTIWLASGTYDGASISRSGSDGAPITIAAADGARAAIAPGERSVTLDLVGIHNISLIGLDVQGPSGSALTAIRLERSTGISILGSTIHDTNGGFGIDVRFSADVEIRGNDLGHNAVGIRLFGEGDPGSVHDVMIEQNAIHDSDSMIVNDQAPDNDFGANGIIWHKVSGRTVARDNQVWSSHAASHDYGTDGGAFEIWASSNMLISGNVAWDNLNVMETGSDGDPCSNITFSRNVAFVTTRGVGLILRCASDSLIAHNVLDRMNEYAFELSDNTSGNPFATSVAGLRILNNIVVGSRVYAVRNPLPDSVILDYNLAWDSNGPVARLPDHGDVGTLEDLARATGYEAHGVSGDPRFVDREGHDYRLRASSPALDAGVPTGADGPVDGAAPDIGRYEGVAPPPSGS